MPSRNVVILVLATVISMVCYRTAARNHYGGLLAHAIGEIDDRFVRPVDKRKLFEGAMDGMVRQLDPYSDYISPEELAAFSEELDQEFGGIGVVVEVNSETNRLTVLSPLPDTPAYAAGMQAGDQILEIDGQATDDFQIGDAVELMRGQPGTEIELLLLHAGDSSPVRVNMERAIIPIASVLGDVRRPDGTWQFQLESHPHIGYIRLVNFGEKTAEELSKTLLELQPQVQGIIIDLRQNGGGLLEAAVEICDQFIDNGNIVSIRGRDPSGWRDYIASPDNTIVNADLPVALLIDGYSASASEIMAACLQDHQRATVVGTRSWGKGTVQTVMYFEGGRSRLKLTVATYWRPNGKNIHRHVDATPEDAWGVTPDQGYLVELDAETLAAIREVRRERDKVNITKDVAPEVETEANDDSSSKPAEAAPEATPSSSQHDEGTADEGTTEEAKRTTDPQLQRAIEAIEAAINGAASASEEPSAA